MKLLALPAFSDNYIWMLHDGRDAVVVDPGEAGPVTAALDALGLRLAAILVTHHHNDHVGGVDALRSRSRSRVYGPAHETIPPPYVRLNDGDHCEALGWRFDVIDVPGHTSGHIAFYAAPADESPVLFCGDTLFSGGCGRLFEGTPQQMLTSLTRLATLPGATRVCCGHEYTLANLRFARTVEPGNAALVDYDAWCHDTRAHGLPTLPSTIERERSVNPFLRCGESAVQHSARQHGAGDGDLAVFTTLRQWKNEFR